MIAHRLSIRFAAAPLALALAMLAVGHAAPALAKAQDPVESIDAELAKGDAAHGIALGEAAVAADPRNGTLRAALGRAYLKDGRFQSAVAALTDAMALGETGSRTLLTLALADVGSGHDRDAVAVLDQGRGTIPAADLGLALALAGEAGRGTTIMGDAVRAGDKSDKLRANLAYAYALDGRWAEARNLLAMDLPADQVDGRLTEWAQLAKPEGSRDRVAALLGVGVKADGGMPTQLALGPTPFGQQQVQTAAADPMPATALAAATAVELPPLAAPDVPVQAAPEPVAAPTFTPIAPKGGDAKLALAPRHPRAHVAAKPIEPAPANMSEKTEAVTAKSASGSHLVQLGAFISQKNAEHAKQQFLARDRELRGHEVTIAQAMVNGRKFWRVSVAGYNAGAASQTCQSIQKKGGACFARSGGTVSTGKALAMATPVGHRGH
jgi:Flp pilus assembly protein TadD